MSAEAAVSDAWEREGSKGRWSAQLCLVGGKLPSNPVDRFLFCVSYGDKFDGDNHEEAVSYASFCVYYRKGMRLPPYDDEEARR